MTTTPSILHHARSRRAQETFYPTPQALADKLLEGIDLRFVQSVLEPSAGKGDLAMAAVKKLVYWSDHYNSYPADAVEKCDIDCIEIDPTLRQTLDGAGFRVVHDDFLTFQTQKRYNLIIMNPPFDQGAEHLLKALELSERGGMVRCLLNAETLRNPYSEARKQLVKKLAGYGAKIEFQQNAFASAERRTDVEIAIVSVDIPAVKVDSTIMDDMRKAPTYKAQEIPPQFAEIVKYNSIDEWVNRYNFEVACGIRLIEEYESMMRCMPEETGMNEDRILEMYIRAPGGDKKRETTVNNYIRQVRGKYWRAIFQHPTFTSKLTYNLQQELQDNVRQLMDYDFSAYNILTLLMKMNQKVVGGIEQTILALFDDWTGKYHWSDTTSNRHYFDGWKTNDCFAVGKKVIIPFYGAFDSWDKRFQSYQVRQKFADIEKVFDFLDSGRTEWEESVDAILKRVEATQNTKNIDTKYFTVTFFKKGTAHFVFKDAELLEKFNLFAAKNKNWLPPCYGKKRYEDMTKEEQHVVDSFQGKERYQHVLDHADYYLPESGPVIPLLPGA